MSKYQQVAVAMCGSYCLGIVQGRVEETLNWAWYDGWYIALAAGLVIGWVATRITSR